MNVYVLVGEDDHDQTVLGVYSSQEIACAQIKNIEWSVHADRYAHAYDADGSLYNVYKWELDTEMEDW